MSDNQLPVLFCTEQLVVRANRVCLTCSVKTSFGLVDVGSSQGGPDVFQIQTKRRQCCRVGLDSNGGLLSPADTHHSDPGQLRDLLDQSSISQIFHFEEWQ